MKRREQITVRLSEEDRKKNHVPGWVFRLSREHDVYIRDEKTGEQVQVLDLTHEQMTLAREAGDPGSTPMGTH